jgi:hypothetical protein
MFQNCGLKQILRESATLAANPAVTDVTPGYVGDQNTGGLYFVMRTTGRSAGTCLVDLLTSYDGVTYSELSSYQQNITVNGFVYINIDGPIPAYVGIRLTPSGGPDFNGSVEVDAYSSGRLLFN